MIPKAIVVAVAALVAGCGSVGTTDRTDQSDRTDEITVPVVVVGIAGLAWDSVSERRTPNLWRLLDRGADAAAVTVRTVHSPPCPMDGWLSLSAGRAATDPERCSHLPSITGGRVDGWDRLVAGQSASVFDPDLGLLGKTLADSNVCATAVGPGAALALADSTGTVARYHPEPNPRAWDCPITVIDARSDRALGTVLDQLPQAAMLIVLGLGDSEPEMGVMVIAGPHAGNRFVTASTTRWQGIVRLLDLPSTLAAAAGVQEPNHFTGSPIVASGARPDTSATVAKLTAVTTRDRDLRASAGPFINGLAAAALVLFTVLALRWRRTKVVEAALLATAALPLCSYLVRLIQWWRWPHPLFVLWTGMLVGAIACALVLRKVPRATVWSTATILSGVTVLVLAVDAMTGTILHHGSPMGPSPLSGGRYYGFGNTTFVVFAVHGIILAAGLASLVSRRVAAVAVVAVVGAAIIVIDVWPSYGADLGGGFALVPAFVLLALNRITVGHILVAGVSAVAAVALVGYLDWLRPAERRSHAGRFVEDLVNGDGIAVVTRKADYAVHSLSAGPHIWLTGCLLACLIVFVFLPGRPGIVRTWPRFWGVYVAVVAVAAIGSVTNDYGLRVALITIGVAAPPLMLIWLSGPGRHQ